MRAAKKLTEPRRQLLERLVRGGGSLHAIYLAVPSRVLGSRMSYDKLVRWTGPNGDRNLDNWTLHITDAGRKALDEGA